MPATTNVHEPVDVVIVGGGAAGLSAAVALGRARRSVVVVDAGEPRNAPAAHMHGLLSRDGISPAEFLSIGRGEAQGYGVQFIDDRATTVSRAGEGPFVVELASGGSVSGRRLLVTTGLVDELPEIPGLRERWGREVIHCPYCHGWEVRDQRIVVIATGPMAIHQTQLFRQWSSSVALIVHTGPAPTTLQREELASRSIDIIEGEIASIVVDDDRVVGVSLGDGRVVPADAVVVGARMTARSGVLSGLGLEAVEHPMGFGTYVPSGPMGSTDVPGVWVAGNVTELNAQVVHAAGAGTFAGAAINADLVVDDTRRAMDAMHAAHAAHAPVMDKRFWDERYASAPTIWSGNANPHLVTEAGDLVPGTALDIGAGEGADARWLAQRGWTVTAVDISTVALDRARSLATDVDADAAERITWQQADVTEWSPPTASFDLVSSQFMHLPSAQRTPYIQRCAAAVRPGGVLLVVGHHIHDLETTAGRPHLPDLFFSADDIAADLDGMGEGDAWTILAADARPRAVDDASGQRITIEDAVLVARRDAPTVNRPAAGA